MKIYLKNSIAVIFSLSGLLSAAQTAKQITLNQVGYFTNASKAAIVVNATAANSFFVLSANKKDTVFKGILGKPIQSLYSATITQKANFNNLKKPGNYLLFVPGVGYSAAFVIGKNIYSAIAKAAIKAYYFQRASMPLEKRFAGIWARKEGHPDTTVFIHTSAATTAREANSTIATPGGWYDAGDYNKYIVNSGITMGTMLSGYEDFNAYFKTVKTNIPETGNGVPDILNEVLYNLHWMFTMQDTDGGVYHKCTNANFDAMIMPEAAVAKRYVVQKGTAASLDFAAVMAQANRIYKQFPKQFPGLADSCLAAAKLAWKWSVANPAIVYEQNELNKHYSPAIVTGDYGDGNFKDEFFWAACELLATTKDLSYLPTIENAPINSMALPSWANVNLLGCYTLVRLKSQLPAAAKKSVVLAEKRINDLADNLLLNGGNKAFGSIFGQSKNDFVWGSNSVAMNQSIVLINTYLTTKNKKYLTAALTNMDYILGQNATGYCFVTGFGTRPAIHPHHRPSVADGITDPIPGLLVGGPNPGMQDKCVYANKETETAYTDDDCAYACNEIAINWNAPFVYVANAIEALQLNLQ